MLTYFIQNITQQLILLILVTVNFSSFSAESDRYAKGVVAEVAAVLTGISKVSQRIYFARHLLWSEPRLAVRWYVCFRKKSKLRF